MFWQKMDDKSKQTYTSDTINALNTILKVRQAGLGLVLLSDVSVFLSQSNISVLPLISGVVLVMLKNLLVHINLEGLWITVNTLRTIP